MPNQSAAGRFFITLTAVEQWAQIIEPSATYDQALASVIDWSRDAKRVRDTEHGVSRYRARRPLECYFLVDETQKPLPAITAIGRPHANWKPRPRPSTGRPVGRPALPPEQRATVNPELRLRIPPGLLEEATAVASMRHKSVGDWVRELIQAQVNLAQHAEFLGSG